MGSARNVSRWFMVFSLLAICLIPVGCGKAPTGPGVNDWLVVNRTDDNGQARIDSLWIGSVSGKYLSNHIDGIRDQGGN